MMTWSVCDQHGSYRSSEGCDKCEQVTDDLQPPTMTASVPVTEGKKLDGGKVRMNLVPPLAIGFLLNQSPARCLYGFAAKQDDEHVLIMALRILFRDGDDLEAMGRVMTFGAQKYDAYNWSKGIHYSRLIAAALRHLAAGDALDAETGEEHRIHAMCCISMLYDMTCIHPELDDRDPSYKEIA